MIALFDLLAFSCSIIALGFVLVKPISLSVLSYSLLLLFITLTSVVYGLSAMEWFKVVLSDWPIVLFEANAAIHNYLQTAQSISCFLLMASFFVSKGK